MDMKELSENVKAIDVVRQMVADGQVSKDVAEKYFPELKDSEDETIRKVLIQYFSTFRLGTFAGLEPKKIIDWLEKQGEQKDAKNIVETWKEMRLEVYQQASGNRHEPNYSDDTTKMFSLNDIDEIIEKISEQKPNPYSGTSFEYNGHTWGMCARDNGVELLLDGELKAFLSLEKNHYMTT